VNSTESHFVVKALSDDECAKLYGVKDYPSLILIRNKEEIYQLKLEDEERIETERVQEWVWKHALDQFVEVQDYSLDFLHNQRQPLILAFSTNPEDSNLVESSDFKTYVHAFADMNMATSRELAKCLGVDNLVLPLLLVYEPHTNHKWLPSASQEELSLNSIKELIEQYEKGELVHYLKSEEDGLAKRKNAVLTKLTGKTHDQFLTQSLGDIFVLYCNPEIELCENIEKELEVAMKELKRIPSLYLGLLNSALNELENQDFSSLPELAFFPRSDHTKKVLFNKDRMDSESLFSWMKMVSHVIRIAKKMAREDL